MDRADINPAAWFEAGMVIGMLHMMPEKEREIAIYAILGKMHELEDSKAGAQISRQKGAESGANH